MKYLYVKYNKLIANNIDLSSFPKQPNTIPIYELRKEWGEDAKIIKTAKYCYKVDAETFETIRNFNRFKF